MTAVFHRGGDATRRVMLLDRRWWQTLKEDQERKEDEGDGGIVKLLSRVQTEQ